MEWLTPLTGAVAAAATVPLLVLMYFLKLRRTETVVSSTLLWRRAVQDLRVNAPFQKLRRNILFFLQLLALAALLTALARPMLRLSGGPGKRYVILIDRSASMNARDADGSRLEAAKRQAVQLVDSLRSWVTFRLADTSEQAMVIAFDDHAKVMCNFTSDKTRLKRAIEAIEAGDGGSLLSEALAAARAFAVGAGEEGNDLDARQLAQLELFSDGRIADAEDLLVRGGELNYHRVGDASSNLGVTAMEARRSYERPEEVEVFATVSNAGPKAVSCDVQLSLDGNIRAVRSVKLPPAAPPADGKPAVTGKVSISFGLSHGGAGVMEVRLLHADPLPTDDAAWAVLTPPRRLAALLVTRSGMALQMALKACPLAKLDVVSPEQFDAMDHAAMTVNQPYDVIILDGYAPKSCPQGRYICFGPPPEIVGATVGGLVKNEYCVDWRARHPVLQFVNMGNVFVARATRMELPRETVVLAEFSNAPAMALLTRGGSAFLVVAFDAMESNWPFQPGLVIFIQNATAFLGREIGQTQQRSLKVGQAITVLGERTDRPARITGPGGVDVEIVPDTAGTIRFPGTTRAGVYAVALPDRSVQAFAVNVLDAKESDIAPAEEMVFSGESVKAQPGPVVRTNREIWPWLAVLVLALVCLEWFVYNSKLRL